MKESNTDVLIVGAGPAGHMAMTWFARCGVKARIIDKRPDSRFIGQADGLQSRTIEVFQSFGFGDRAQKEAYHMLEMCFWEPDANGNIVRSNRMPDSTIGISRFQQSVLHQGRVESFMRESVKKWSKDTLKIERPVQATSLKVDESVPESDTNAYPVTVTVKHMKEDVAAVNQYGAKIANGLFRAFDGDGNGEKEGEEETIHAKYVIGCDGAHSWVRRSLGIEMKGESTDYVWGVMDGVPITDFPDIRSRCAIHSAESGSIMVIPREHGMVRLYIQLAQVPIDPEKSRIDRSKITPELIMDNARKIFSPYKIEMKFVKWYTAYQIGQRVATKFSDPNHRVFITGDACHTHSPKAGQGMNVSMMDSYNLAWKIGHVVRKLAPPEILNTYETERKKVAQELIDYDYKLSRLFSGKPAVAGKSENGIDTKEFHDYFEKGNGFASGTIVDYRPSILVDKPEVKYLGEGEGDEAYYSPLATKAPIGRRLDTVQVMTQCDTKPVQLADVMPSDGRWRIVYFSGDIVNNSQLMKNAQAISDVLTSSDSFVKKYTPATCMPDSVIDVLMVHASGRWDLEWNTIPEAFRPVDPYGRQDYWNVFADDKPYHFPHGHAYEKFGINPSKGALLVLRPDGHLAKVSEASVDGLKEIEQFFGSVLLEQKPSWKSNGGYLDTGKELEEWYGIADYGSPVLAQ